jgi:DNA-binding YbaB/EbfC family protein
MRRHEVLKGLGNLASLMKQAQEVSGRMQGLAEELRAKRVVGSAGGGLVEIEANGASEVLGCRIDPSLLKETEKELLEDLVATAINQALEKAKQLHAESLKNLTGNMELPGLSEAMEKLTGGNR